MRFPLPEPPEATLGALANALDMLDVGVVLASPALRVRFVNRRFSETFDFPDSLLATAPTLRDLLFHAAREGFFAIPGRDLRDFVNTRLRAIEAGTGEPFVIEMADGRRLRGRSVRCPDGGRLLSYTDVSHEPRQEDIDTQRRINAELRFNSETLEDYAAHLASLAEAAEDSAQRAEAARLLLEGEIAERRELEARLRELATTDSLTGALNRAESLAVGQRELEAAQRFQQSLAVLMLDIDYFKAINDRFGHAGGDQALRHIVAVLGSAIRSADALGRLGGEEFVIILPATAGEAAMQVAERLRALIAETPAGFHGETISMTVSIGLAITDPSDRSIDAVIGRADDALYRAKNAGRDRVMLAGSLAGTWPAV